MKYAVIPSKEFISYEMFDSIILPLKDYSIGFDRYFTYQEINELSKKMEVSVIINRLLHKDDMESIVLIIKKLINIHKFFIEDYGLIDIINKDLIVLMPSHVINNYECIKYLYDCGIKSVLVSNELHNEELKTIIESTKSDLYYFYVSRNILMYSKRSLISNYKKYYNINKKDNLFLITEKVSKKKLYIKEESKETVVLNDSIYVASKYIDILKKMNTLIVNLSNLTKKEEEIILNNFKNNNLHNIIDCDYYFLENKVAYKVGDLNE
ncbi:MAG: U32 family peptidase [Bacilli bacterium]